MSVTPPLKPTVPAERAGPEKIEAVHRIVDEETLGLVFQPIFGLKTGEVFGYEALARSPSPLFETLPDLYEAAAQAGRVGELGRLHRTQAVRAAPAKPLFLNVNPNEFDYGWLVRPDDPIFRHRQTVFLEITESVPLSHFDQCKGVLAEVRKKGVLLAIDDLGAGYSNLKYIADLSPDVVKVDRDLVADLRDGSRQYKLLAAIVQLCRAMGARVVAEGIETVEELLAAERAGVELCQGYLLGRPGDPGGEKSWPAFR